MVLVAGETWGNESIYIRQIKRLGIEKEVVLVDNYVPDGKVTDYFRASDLVVLPYLSATGSGVVKLAYSYGRPVVVTNTGSLPDAVIPGKTGYIVEPGNAQALADAILEFLKRADKAKMKETIIQYRQTFGWGQLVDSLHELM